MESLSNPDHSLEYIAIKVGVSCDRIVFLKKFYNTYSGGSVVELREAAIVNRLSAEELHAIFIHVGQSIFLKSKKRK